MDKDRPSIAINHLGQEYEQNAQIARRELVKFKKIDQLISSGAIKREVAQINGLNIWVLTSAQEQLPIDPSILKKIATIHDQAVEGFDIHNTPARTGLETESMCVTITNRVNRLLPNSYTLFGNETCEELDDFPNFNTFTGYGGHAVSAVPQEDGQSIIAVDLALESQKKLLPKEQDVFDILTIISDNETNLRTSLQTIYGGTWKTYEEWEASHSRE